MSEWTCASCSGRNAAGTAYCGHCGRPGQTPAAGWSCRDCGGDNPATSRFCGRCGGRRREARDDEVRLTTALFCDISGFTALADRLDTEELHEVVRPIVAAFAEIAERYEGFVEKYAGDALLVVFGAPTAHEDDPQRALLAALDMHAALPALREQVGPLGEHLGIHVGVNTGRVISGSTGSAASSDYAVLGDSVILAQRLESVCPTGQTYVGRTTYELTHAEFELEPVGPLTLKGKSRPVEAFRLVGRRRPAATAALPLVGRAAEAAQVESAVAAGSRAVVLSGEAGSGKSRLLEHLTDGWRARGTGVLTARCLSYGAGLPYWPFGDLLRRQLGVAADAPNDHVRTAVADLLPAPAHAGALRLLGAVDDDVEPTTARRQVHDGVRAWLAGEVAARPLVLIVEDAHWLDRASTDLVVELLSGERPDGVTVVLTARPALDPALDGALVETGAARVVLPALDRSATAELAAGVLGGPVAETVAAVLAERTAGNPLFAEELARTLQEQGVLVPTSAGWDLVPGADLGDVPTTVERVLAARLDALDVPSAGLLQLAAVTGARVPVRLLAEVAAGQGATLEPLTRLVAAGLLHEEADPDGERVVVFHHAVLQDVAHGRLLRRRRRELHEAVAVAARRLYGDGDDTVGLLARHLHLAGSLEALPLLLRAGRRARTLHAHDEAAVHLQAAAETVRADGDGVALDDVLLELGEVQEARGAYAEAAHCYEEVRRRSGDVRAWRGAAAVLRKRGCYDEALEVLDRGPAGAAELLLERGHTLALAGRVVESEQALRRGLTAAERGTRTYALLLLQLAETLEVLDRLDEAEVAAEEAGRLFAARGEPGDEASAHRVAGGIARMAGRFDAAGARLRRAEELSRRSGRVEEAAGALLTLGAVLLDAGDVEAGVDATVQGVRVFERLGHGSGRAVGYGNLADGHARLGRWDEAERWARTAQEHAERIGHAPTLADVAVTMTHVRLGQRRWHDAVAAADDAARRLRELGADSAADAVLALAEPARQALTAGTG